MYTWDYNILWGYRWLFLNGTLVTVALTIGIIVLGLLVGLVTGLAQLSRGAMVIVQRRHGGVPGFDR